jgi:hypothetical protein
MKKDDRPQMAANQSGRAATSALTSLVPPRSSAAEAARYIAEFTAELSSLAKQSGLDLLAYLLDLAHLEATRLEEETIAAKGSQGP